nr:hypothetical protein [Pirellulales bacterium]
PSNVARIFLGTVNGGIWRSTNGNAPFNGVDDDGVNGVDDPAEQPDWEPLTDEFASLAIGDIRFDPLDASNNTLFAGTGSASSLSGAGGAAIGVMRTTDGGNTWAVFPVNPGGAEPQLRAVLPTTFDANAAMAGVQQVVLVGANSNTGLYRSTDGGQTYTAISGTNGLPNGAVTQIIADPNNASQYFAGVVGQGVFRSVNGGLNWTAVNTNLTNLGTSSLVEVAAHPNGGTTRLYAMISGFTGSSAAGTLAAVRTAVFTSTNSGNTWTPLAAVPAGFDSSRPDLFTGMAADQLVIDPANPLIAYIAKGYGGSPILYRYNPGGAGSWALIDSAGANGNTRPHVDSRDLQFAGTNVLIHANDGGIYFMANPQNAAANRWTSLHGSGAAGLGATEYHNVAYDSTFNVIFGGAQDNGTSVQNSAGNVIWTQFQGSDGGDVVVDTVNAGAGQVFRYASTQNLGVLNRYTFNSATGIVGGSTVDLMPAGGLANFNAPFVPHYELNTVTPARLVNGASGNNPGTNPVYELLNAATAANAAAANWQAVPIGAGFVGVNRGTLVYGGRLGGVNNAEVLLAGSGSGVFVRSTGGGTLTATPTAFPGGAVQDIAVDPENWQHFFVADGAGVYETPDAGTTWTNLTRNLGLINIALQSLTFIPTMGLGAIVTGGNLGVSKLLLDSAADMWTRFGAGLPNAVVDDLIYDATDDVLLAGTFGRGAFTVNNASVVAEVDGVLNICGDELFVNQDDVIRLVRNAMNPLILDVFLNSVAPVFSVALALVNQINVFGVGGNDTLIVDSTNGLINVPDGIRYDGDGACPDDGGEGDNHDHAGYDRGIDTLELRQTGGVVHTSDTLTVGATIGSGISRVVGAGAGNTQTVFFEELEPIIDNVSALNFNVNGALIGSLLNAANQITYDDSDLFDATWARITVDGFEPVHFQAKQIVTIDAENGDDVVVLNKAARPTGLTQLQVLGDNGHDTVRILAVPEAIGGFTNVQVFGGAGNDVIDGGLSSTNTPLLLNGDQGNDTLTGGAGADTLRGGGNDDTLVDSPAVDVFDGGAGLDSLVVFGSDGNDLIDVFQLAPSGVVGDNYDVSVINGPVAGPFVAVVDEIVTTNPAQAPNNAANRPTVERIRIEALAGDDVLRVGHADAYGDANGANGVAAQTLAFQIQGDSPNASDRLAVRDDGLGDLVIQRLGADQRSGSFVVGGMAPIDYAGIEFANVLPLNVITGGTGTDGLGRLVVFKHDPFETNDSLATAWFLGAGVTLNADPTIDPAGFDFPPAGPDPFDIPGDNDFFRFVAQENGTLDFQVYFTPVGTLANGRPGLPGNGELTVTVFDANGLPVAVGTATDILDDNDTPAPGDDVKIGERIAIPVVRNRTYYLRITGQSASAINVYNFTAINIVAPIPQLVDLQTASDSGRHNSDDITKITTPTFDIILDDDRIDEFANQDLIPDTVNDDLPTQSNAGGARIDYGVEVFNNAVSIGFAFYTGVGNTWRFTATAGDLVEGSSNFISAAVWIRDASLPLATAPISRHELSTPLQVTLDTVTPPGSFGLPDAASVIDGLAADSDTGVTTMPATYADRATSDTTPRLWGRAEANTIVRVFLDRNNNGIIDLLTDTFLGQTVALPFDGNDAYPDGYWELTTALDLNEIVGLPKDGLRRLLVTAEDVAGNPMPMANQIADGVDELQIFIDTQGPQITDVTANNLTAAQYDVFDPKPTTTGPTPLIHSLRITVLDQPNRVDSVLAINDFLYEALKPDVAAAPGNYVLVGDHVGVIPIQSVVVTNNPRIGGAPATASVVLNFFSPLPDDRYTLTVRDNLVDPVNNKLDGESNAAEPQESPLFPTGDGVPGGNFFGRFTVDSRPEIASVIPQQINIDVNGNFVWDPGTVPVGGDATNVDLTFTMQVANPITGAHAPGGFGVHDLVFAGKFTSRNAGAAVIPLFDQLAVYGNAQDLASFRWLIDRNSDAVINTADGDVLTLQPLQAGFDVAGAIPVAGNFDRNAANGDEIGLYKFGVWILDRDRDFVIETNGDDTIITGTLLGHPIVGDFDRDRFDDLGVFNNNTWYFDMAFDGLGATNANGFGADAAGGDRDDSIIWGFPGVLDRPVAADVDRDG